MSEEQAGGRTCFSSWLFPWEGPVRPAGKRLVGGSSGTDSAPGMAVIPGTDTLGPAGCKKQKKPPNPTD